MESEYLDRHLGTLREQLAGSKDWTDRVCTVGRCTPRDVNDPMHSVSSVPKQRSIQLYRDMIAELEWAKKATRTEVLANRKAQDEKVPAYLYAYYAGAIPQQDLSWNDICRLAMLETIDVALGIHPSCRRVG